MICCYDEAMEPTSKLDTWEAKSSEELLPKRWHWALWVDVEFGGPSVIKLGTLRPYLQRIFCSLELIGPRLQSPRDL